MVTVPGASAIPCPFRGVGRIQGKFMPRGQDTLDWKNLGRGENRRRKNYFVVMSLDMIRESVSLTCKTTGVQNCSVRSASNSKNTRISLAR